MKGDRLYCFNCKRYSVDTNELYDSRNGGRPSYRAPKKCRYIWRCPHCFYSSMINVNKVIADGILFIAENKEHLLAPLYFKFIEDWPELQQKALSSLARSILVRPKNGSD